MGEIIMLINQKTLITLFIMCMQITSNNSTVQEAVSYAKFGPDQKVHTKSDRGLNALPIYNQDLIFNILTTYWNNKQRSHEFELAIKQNLYNPYLKKMFIFYENFNGQVPDFLDNPKVEIIKIKSAPTHRDFYSFANRHLNGELTIIANSDIILDNTLALLKYVDFNKYIIALTRYNYKSNWPNNNDGCMDTWIFRSPIKYINGNYRVGIFGNEHIMIYEWLKMGYQIINPSLSITTWHVHKSNERTKACIKGFPNCPDYRVKITTLKESLTTPNKDICQLRQYVRTTKPLSQIENFIGRER